MKNGLCTVLVCLTIISAFEQTAASQYHHASGETATTLVQDYADRVNGLLQDVRANLQTISERAEARTLTAQQAQEQKLAATRAMIARLETLSAVYDAKIATIAGARNRCTVESRASNDAAGQGMRSRLTVNVSELESTVTRAARP